MDDFWDVTNISKKYLSPISMAEEILSWKRRQEIPPKIV
jgi:hypothetical protein